MNERFRHDDNNENNNNNDNGYVPQDWGEARFNALWQRCLAAVPVAVAAPYARLAMLYGEPMRHYHTFDHIQHCLQEFDAIAGQLEHADAVEMALWFHDAIYVPGASDNEQRSAQLFRSCAVGGDPGFCQRVDELIMVTTHRVPPHGHDERFMVDIDLSSFGQPWTEFLHDGQDLRAESAHSDDAGYYQSQLRFLNSLYQRPNLFQTAFFQARYEQAARTNIERLIARLRACGYGSSS